MPPGPGQNQGRGQRPSRPPEDWGAMRQNREGYQPQFQSHYQHSYGSQAESPGPSSAHRGNSESHASSHLHRPSTLMDASDERRDRNVCLNIGSPEEGQVMEEGQISESPCRAKSAESDRSNIQPTSTPARQAEASQPGTFPATIHSPLSPTNNVSTETKPQEPDQDVQCSDDRAKKPRLKFGGGLVIFE
jgi:hypothetical protein